MTAASTDSTGEDPPIVQLVNRAEFFASRGQLKLAIGKYQEAMDAQEPAGRRFSIGSPSFTWLRGSSLEAIGVLRRSLDEGPGQLPVYSRLGEAFLAIGRADSAIFFISEARELAPETSAIRSSLGFLYLQSTASRPRQIPSSTQRSSSMSAIPKPIGFSVSTTRRRTRSGRRSTITRESSSSALRMSRPTTTSPFFVQPWVSTRNRSISTSAQKS